MPTHMTVFKSPE